jgi:hypothetical protein
MILGLPGTSGPVQVSVEQPRTVIVPMNVPALMGANGVMTIWPVVSPVMMKLWLNSLPVCEVAT